jgi:putative oxidoreductase
MKIAILITRILFGFAFFASGLSGILHLGKMTGMSPDSTTFVTLMMNHGYMNFVSLLMLIAGLLVLVGRFVPLGLVILGPILVNILMFHILFEHRGISVGIVLTVLELFLIWVYRLSFRGLFDAAPELS